MKTTKVSKTLLAMLVAGTVTVTTAGCQNDRDQQVKGYEFTPRGERRTVERFAEAQAAAGARTDATLRSYHFDQGALNSLGQEKLDLMLRDGRSPQPMTVYIDVPGGGATGGSEGDREESVRTYLKDSGVGEGQAVVRQGPNPNHSRPATEGMAELEAAGKAKSSGSENTSALNLVDGTKPKE